MVMPDAHDNRDIGIDQIDRVEPPAEADLEQGDIDIGPNEEVKGRERPELEVGQHRLTPSLIDTREGGTEIGVPDHRTGDADALVVLQQMRRGIGTTAVTGRSIPGLEIGDAGALAVGTANGDDRKRQRARGQLRMQSRPDLAHPFQAQIDSARV